MVADSPTGIDSQFRAIKEISAAPLAPGVEGMLVDTYNTYCRENTFRIFKSIFEKANNRTFAKR